MYVPARADFLASAEPGTIVPIYREILADRLTPVSAFERVAGEPGTFLFESVEGGERIARYSFIGWRPYETLRVRDGVATLEGRDGTVSAEFCGETDPLSVVERALERYRFVPAPGLPRFCGGAVGFLSYDLVRRFERLPDITDDDLGLGDCCLLFTEGLLVFDHVRHRIKVLVCARVDGDPEAVYDAAVAEIERVAALLRGAGTPPPWTPQPGASRTATASATQEEYEGFVARCKEYIAAGDAFQVVPSVRFTRETTAPPFELYRALRSLNPSPYMYFVDLGDMQIVGTSPEILVTVEDGRVTVRPIAGTRPRGADSEADAALERELLADEKERSEHIMLVDLGRNDVGRVAEYGTVRVDELMAIERYSHVMHIVSNVSGELSSECTVFDAVRACFPAGTLTGAPKVRAMEIIEELEPVRRGLYGGAVGYFGYSGGADFAIAIRTMLIRDGRAHMQAGAGIVADSVPASEYRECVNKAGALLAAIEMAEQGLD